MAIPAAENPRDIAVIVPAAGAGARFGGPVRKTLIELRGRPVWRWSVDLFLARADVAQVVVVGPPGGLDEFCVDGVTVVAGGATRAESVAAGLSIVDDVPLVAVHDAARPLLRDEDVSRVFEAARADGAAILATSVAATLKRSEDGLIEETVPRDDLWAAQTPQVSRRDWLQAAFAARGNFEPTDEAQLLERAGRPVRLVEGAPTNLKVTRPGDLPLAEAILNAGHAGPED